jgi:hypothetical protein
MHRILIALIAGSTILTFVAVPAEAAPALHGKQPKAWLERQRAFQVLLSFLQTVAMSRPTFDGSQSAT